MRFFLLSMALHCHFLALSQDSEINDRTLTFYPAFGYQPETSFQLGALAVWILKSEDAEQSQFVRSSWVSPFFMYTFRNQILSVANMDYYFNNGLNVNAALSFLSFPELYFGIGGSNEVEDQEIYANIYGQLNGRLYKIVKPQLFVGIAYDLHSTRITDVVEGGMLQTDAANGLSGGNIFGFGPSLRYDTRDNVLYPSKGHFLLIESVFNQLGDYGFNSFTLDLRKFFFIGDQKNIIALQVNGRFTSGADVPFFKLPQLGGAERLRGIANANLYRDRQAVYSQIEYRRYLIWRIGLTAFVGMGDVSPTISDFDIAHFKYIGGLGLRYAVIPKQKLNLRFDFGVSDRGHTAFYVGMQEAF